MNLNQVKTTAFEVMGGAPVRGNLSGKIPSRKIYHTVSCDAGDATLYVKDTADFDAAGSGWIIDSANDRDAFTYTGKTATTLTGVSGVLAHTKSASNTPVVIPAKKNIFISDIVNEIRLFDNRGDGSIEELFFVGPSLASARGMTSTIMGVGSAENAKMGIYVKGKRGTYGQVNALLYVVNDDSATALPGEGIRVEVSRGKAVEGYSGADNAGYFEGNATKGPIGTNVYEHDALPSDRTAGQFIVVHNTAFGTTDYRLAYSDGTDWRQVYNNTVIS